jgi:transposase-like protein
MIALPPLDEILKLISDEYLCIQFLFEKGIFYGERFCVKCCSSMNLSLDRGLWRCTKKGCGTQVSIRQGSFFAKSKLLCSKIMQISYFWLNKIPVSATITMTATSPNTVCNFYRHLRELVADSLDEEDTIIGGNGVVVEIDESKLSKRKYNRGHHIEGAWVIGGIERTEEKRRFIVKIDNRDANTILGVIRAHVLPGSIVYTDMWRGYSRVSEALGLEHHVVNHSAEFVSSDGVHTNTIEAVWCGLKLVIPKRNRTHDVDGHLWEYIWRAKNKVNIWENFLLALREIYYE